MSILLLCPGEIIPKPRVPMSVIALSSHLIANGYECKIVDERIRELTDEEIKAASIIGISTMSGEQLKFAVKTARRVKQVNPDVPLVWGGAHPSAYPEQTATSPLADIVINGEGEIIFLELVKRLLNGEDYSDIAGICYKKGDKVINNPVVGEWMDVNTLEYPHYGLLDLKKYADYEDGLSYESSRGCAFRCKFCYVEYFHKRKWRGKSPENVVSELKRIKEETGVKKIFFTDDNFFGNRKRSMEICAGMVRERLGFKWTATARADFLAKSTDEEMQLIHDAGCEILAIGAESGSEFILTEIQKDITKEQILSAVKKVVKVGIMPTVSFVIGLPFEKESDLEKTLEMYDKIMEIGKDRVEINGLFIYVPYTGTRIFHTAVEYGYKPEETLEGWSTRNFNYSDSTNNPWLKGKARRRIETIAAIARFRFLQHRFEFYSDEFKKQKLTLPFLRLAYRVVTKVFSKIANWRWRRRYFSFAFEWSFWRKMTFLFFKVR